MPRTVVRGVVDDDHHRVCAIHLQSGAAKPGTDEAAGPRIGVPALGSNPYETKHATLWHISSQFCTETRADSRRKRLVMVLGFPDWPPKNQGTPRIMPHGCRCPAALSVRVGGLSRPALLALAILALSGYRYTDSKARVNRRKLGQPANLLQSSFSANLGRRFFL